MVLEPVVDSITLFHDHYDIKLPSGKTIRITPEGIIESIVDGGKTMNYEVGDKFVIEIESIYKQYLSETYEKPIFLYKMKGFNSLVFDKAGLDKLTPVHTEKKVKELIKFIYDLGLEDFHNGNIGFRKNGAPVLLDYSDYNE